MKLIVPAGQGDFSWIHSKLVHVMDEIESIQIIDGAPRRTQEFIHACGYKNVEYSDFDQYQLILTFEHAQGIDWKSEPTWEKIRAIGSDLTFLEANQHLEHGRALAEWLPDLPTEYHYPFYISQEDRDRAAEIMVRAIIGDKRQAGHPMSEGPVVGISCASYKGSKAWQTWGRAEWVEFLKAVMGLGWRPLLVGGSWDDLTYTVACDLDLPYTVGKTNVPQMIEQMALLDSYIGFSSGMNVIRTVHNKPAMALWPCTPQVDQTPLSRAWPPPHMLESERYVAVSWNPVRDIWPVAKAFLRRCESELAMQPKSNGHAKELTD